MFLQILSCELGNCCGNPGIAVLLDISRKILDFIQLIVPILLIIMATIKFIQLVSNPELKGGLSHVKNMFMAAAIVFFIPVIVNATLSILPESFSISACWQQAKVFAESSRNLNFNYISSGENKNRSNILTSPSLYEKGVAKAKSGDAHGILEGTEEVHTKYEQEKWIYSVSGDYLIGNNIEASTNNPKKATCCATLVGSALYVGGVFTEEEINSYNYNSATATSNFLESKGWTKITNYGDLEAGDIVIMTAEGSGGSIGHVQIYAGNGTWYNAGYTGAIQRDNPYSSDASGRFLWAWRINK